MPKQDPNKMRRKTDIENLKRQSRRMAEEYSRDLDEYEKRHPEVSQHRAKKTRDLDKDKQRLEALQREAKKKKGR